MRKATRASTSPEMSGQKGSRQVISIHGVTKRYSRRTALDTIDLELRGPGVISFLGPNGAGKTTLFKLINRLSFPDAGEIIVNGYNVVSEAEKALFCMGSQIDETRFHPYLTGREILSFVYLMRGIPRDMVEERLRTVGEGMGITSFLDDRLGTYSSGMKQRFAIANAIMANTDIIFFDEPTTNLDPSGIAEFRNLIQDLREMGKLILISSHLLSEVSGISDRILIMNRGKIVFDSDFEEIERFLSVRLEEIPDNVPKNIPGVSEISRRGDSIVVKPEKGVSNSEVIERFIEKGFKIREITEVEGLERIYASRTA